MLFLKSIKRTYVSILFIQSRRDYIKNNLKRSLTLEMYQIKNKSIIIHIKTGHFFPMAATLRRPVLTIYLYKLTTNKRSEVTLS